MLLILIGVIIWLNWSAISTRHQLHKQAEAIKTLEAALQVMGGWVTYLGERMEGKDAIPPDQT